MNFLNERIRSLKIQLEAEKARDEPDAEKISVLEEQLHACLSELGLVVKK